MMFRSIEKQLQDMVLGTESGTQAHVRVRMYRYSGATLPLLFSLKFRLPVSNVT
jgi:hypothetical protein